MNGPTYFSLMSLKSACCIAKDRIVAAKAQTVYLYTFLFLSVYLAAHDTASREQNERLKHLHTTALSNYCLLTYSCRYLCPKYGHSRRASSIERACFANK